MTELLTNARIATMTNGRPYGFVDDGAVVIDEEQIAYVGPVAQAPSAERTTDLAGRLVTPGLVDPHTHLVYGGNRAEEWEQCLLGADYAEIARRGGGILATVRATRGSVTSGYCSRRADGWRRYARTASRRSK